MIGLCAIGFLWSAFLAPVVNGRWATVASAYETKRSALDERHHYLSRGGQLPLYRSIVSSSAAAEALVSHYGNPIRRIRSAHEKGLHGLCFEDTVLFGQVACACADLDLYLTDVIALQDPLLARLKADASKHWRIGHAQRAVPSGYHETIATGENRIENPDLHEYYDKLLLVMKAPLFDRKRLRTILDLNRGRFDELLEGYERSPRSMDALELAFHALNTEKDAEKAMALLDRGLLSGMSGHSPAQIRFCRGCVFEDLLGDENSARAEYEKALAGSWDIDLVPCADRLARIKAIRGERNDAIALWEKAARLDPENTGILWNLAVSYRDSGEVEKSAEMLEKARVLTGNPHLGAPSPTESGETSPPRQQ
jgi:tetratricopeptide (TPR) repeat protein